MRLDRSHVCFRHACRTCNYRVRCARESRYKLDNQNIQVETMTHEDRSIRMKYHHARSSCSLGLKSRLSSTWPEASDASPWSSNSGLSPHRGDAPVPLEDVTAAMGIR